MSDCIGACEKVVDPDDPETWGGMKGDKCDIDDKLLNNEGVWNCPHDPVSQIDGEQLCIFHLPVDCKDDGEVVDTFLNVINGATEQDSPTREERLQFIAAEFGTFDLSESPPEITDEDAEIHLTHAVFSDTAVFSNATLNVSRIEFKGANFANSASFYNTVLGNQVHFNNVKFRRIASFLRTEFEGEIYFDQAEFEDRANFLEASFEGETYYRGTVFKNSASFRETEFEQRTTFFDAKFESEANFVDAEFGAEALLFLTEFENIADFGKTEFEDEANFVDAKFSSEVNFFDADFGDGAEFDNTNLTDAQFNNADLTEATFTNACLHNVNFELSVLSRATLTSADLRGAKLDGVVLGDARIDEDTQFIGHPDDNSDSSKHTLSAIRSKPRCVYDPKYEEDNDEADVDKAKSVYRALEELAVKAVRPRLQSQCFVRRQDLQKDQYKQDVKEADSWQERLIAGARYSRAKVARGTLLYGESPWRIIGGSIGFIVLAALFYPLGEWLRPVGEEPITYSRILGGEPGLLLESLYFSTLTFTTLGMGDYEPMGMGQVFATLNTALGAVLIALLVFVLGRRAAR